MSFNTKEHWMPHTTGCNKQRLTKIMTIPKSTGCLEAEQSQMSDCSVGWSWKLDLSNKHQNLFDKYVCAVKVEVDALQVWGPQLGVPQSQCVRRVTPTLVLKYANKDPKLCLSTHKFPGFMMAFQWDGPVEPSWWWNQVLSGVPYWVTITDSWFWFDSNLG